MSIPAKLDRRSTVLSCSIPVRQLVISIWLLAWMTVLSSRCRTLSLKAGQLIGRIGGQTLDTAVYNMNLILPGFITPKLYDGEFWKIHTDDFFSYFNEPLKSQLLAINPRKTPPLSGKIDYDQPGKLIGNWFKEGSGGYAGVTGNTGVGSNGRGYWNGHLSI